MILTNYHTHCTFSDGKQDPETIVKAAIDKGFRAIGISSHGPVDFVNTWAMKPERLSEYVTTIGDIKRRYAGRIEVYLGMEIDYYEGRGEVSYDRSILDYEIGSVHFVTDPNTGARHAVDATPVLLEAGVRIAFGGDIKGYVRSYYAAVESMIQTRRPAIVGHFDLVKKFNRAGGYFGEDEPWYRDAVMPALLSAAARGSIVEINTSIRYRDLGDEAYPSGWILRECRSLGIPIVINSDAHTVDRLCAGFEEARSVARKAGYTCQRVLLGGHWVDVEL